MFISKFKHYLPLVIVAVLCFGRVVASCGVINSGQRCKYEKRIEPLLPLIGRFHALASQRVRQVLPSPHSELVLGMVLGVDDLSMVPKFKEALRTTGTIHVVVVSGFNISLVSSLVSRIIGQPYKVRNLIISLSSTLFYAVLSGFEPPVVRAWIMSGVIILGKHYGRKIDTLQVFL
jgi:competence protein ComEC